MMMPGDDNPDQDAAVAESEVGAEAADGEQVLIVGKGEVELLHLRHSRPVRARGVLPEFFAELPRLPVGQVGDLPRRS